MKAQDIIHKIELRIIELSEVSRLSIESGKRLWRDLTTFANKEYAAVYKSYIAVFLSTISAVIPKEGVTPWVLMSGFVAKGGSSLLDQKKEARVIELRFKENASSQFEQNSVTTGNRTQEHFDQMRSKVEQGARRLEELFSQLSRFLS